MSWLVLDYVAECGYERGCTIVPGDPVWRHSKIQRIQRCERHAPVERDDEELRVSRRDQATRRQTKALILAQQPALIDLRGRRRPTNAEPAE